ncbi:MAG: DUF4419 domain-containing protein [Armatimonas sp.]
MKTLTQPTVVPGNAVEPSQKLLETVSYEEGLRLAIGYSRIEAYSRETRPLLAARVNKKYPPGLDEDVYAHCFITAANAAYDGHYPLVISPDMIWLLIAQGFAIHVRENAEVLRGNLVAHEGKAKLEIRRDEFLRGFAGNDWESVFSEFSEQIKSHIGQETHDTIAPTFSTTGIVEKAAFEITLMDAMQEYFDYGLLTACGIPYYYIEGTPEDWKLLREKARNLDQFQLDWWLTFLNPILDEFVAASEGNPNTIFWRDFYKIQGQSGGPYIQGYIVNLFPYDVPRQWPRESEEETLRRVHRWIEGWNRPEEERQKKIEERYNQLRKEQDELQPVRRNSYLGYTLPEDHDTPDYSPFIQSPDSKLLLKRQPNEFFIDNGMMSCDFPSGLSVAPFTWKYHQTELPMKFVAGFVGASQNTDTFAIRPEIGWAIVEADSL